MSTHGHTVGYARTPTYGSWCSMKQRVRGHLDGDCYHARGIAMHPAWESFEAFLADMGERPPGTSIDRIDNDGNYEPGNCRWATRSQQARNKRSTRLFEFRGERKSIADWALARGIAQTTIYFRLRRGWSVEMALSAAPTPLGERRWGARAI